MKLSSDYKYVTDVELLERLRHLDAELEELGHYVSSNTVCLAIARLEELLPGKVHGVG